MPSVFDQRERASRVYIPNFPRKFSFLSLAVPERNIKIKPSNLSTMNFTTIIALLSMIGSSASVVLAIAAVFISVPVFLLRAAGLMEAPPRIALAKRQVRLSRIRLIGSGLSANQWHLGRPLGPDEAAFLTRELDLLIEEELADLRAVEEEREKEERKRGRRGWLAHGGMGEVGRRLWSVLTGQDRPCGRADLEEGLGEEAADLAAGFSRLSLDGIPMGSITGVVSRRPSVLAEE